MTEQQVLTCTVAAVATLGVLVRPFAWPEAVWSVAGAVALLLLRLITPSDALAGVAKGLDVYLFLIGMMLLAETARAEGLFDWLAAIATKRARGSASRLFFLVYAVGTIVTIFLSNDATAVVLTPAVAASVRAAKAKQPLPYLLICAFIANAASFVLPISNPANLVIYGSRMPPLVEWIPRFALPSLVSIVSTFFLLRFTQRNSLSQPIEQSVEVPPLRGEAVVAAVGIGLTAVALLIASALDIELGLPTAIAGGLTSLVVLAWARRSPRAIVAAVSWGVLPLVAGLFVLVEGLDRAGLVGRIGAELADAAARSPIHAAWGAGLVVGFGSNLVNNLPAGLVAGSALAAAHPPDSVTRAVLIGVDLGPNLSVTGSLATILWLTALRREGQTVRAGAFLKLGLVVMIPALLLTLMAARLSG